MHFGARKVKGAGPVGKAAVMGLLERSEEKKKSKVKLRVAKTLTRAELQGIVRANVTAGSHVYTDALRSYQGLNADFVHKVVDHAECYVKGRVHTNGLENFWALLKRCIKGTYVCVAPFHLFRYLDEEATRFNERAKNDAGRFVDAMSRVSGRRLTYAKLTAQPIG